MKIPLILFLVVIILCFFMFKVFAQPKYERLDDLVEISGDTITLKYTITLPLLGISLSKGTQIKISE